jgi:hypothetical protein
MKYIKKFNEELVSEHLQYHIDNNMSVTENIFRYGSDSYFKLLKESRELYDSGKIELSGHDKELFEEKAKKLIYIIVSNVDFPEIKIRFVKGTDLIVYYPYVKIPSKDLIKFFN